jgi:hypothetical protein
VKDQIDVQESSFDVCGDERQALNVRDTKTLFATEKTIETRARAHKNGSNSTDRAADSAVVIRASQTMLGQVLAVLSHGGHFGRDSSRILVQILLHRG